MDHWKPRSFWSGEDVYIIGGGDSLHQFDWELLRHRNTIGCNGAYRNPGSPFCKIVLFGDIMWWERFGRKGTEEYGGLVVGCSNKLKRATTPWLLTLPRHTERGLGTEGLAWHGSTGAMAVNLALILGASRVFLLGFDMKLGGSRLPERAGKANYHDERYEPSKTSVYKGFCNKFKLLNRSLPQVFPGREIWNVTDDSDLNVFPKIGLEEHFNGKDKSC